MISVVPWADNINNLIRCVECTFYNVYVILQWINSHKTSCIYRLLCIIVILKHEIDLDI